MDLREFIQKTLTQIAEGVHAAQEAIDLVGGVVNPQDQRGTRPKDVMVISGDRIVERVEFDVAIVATEQQGGSAGLEVFGIVRGGIAKELREGSESRVKFTVPLVLPQSGPTKLQSQERLRS
jgi:hypothetical protein